MITIVRAVQTSVACPAQWDAWDAEGRYYYLRFRYGNGTVQAMDDSEDRNYLADPVASFTDDDQWNGTIELEEFAQRAGIALSPRLESKGFGEYFAEAVDRAVKENLKKEEKE